MKSEFRTCWHIDVPSFRSCLYFTVACDHDVTYFIRLSNMWIWVISRAGPSIRLSILRGKNFVSGYYSQTPLLYSFHTCHPYRYYCLLPTWVGVTRSAQSERNGLHFLAHFFCELNGTKFGVVLKHQGEHPETTSECIQTKQPTHKKYKL